MSPVNATWSNEAATVALVTLVAELPVIAPWCIACMYPRPLRMYTYIGLDIGLPACLARAFVLPPLYFNETYKTEQNYVVLCQRGLSGLSIVPVPSSPLPFPPASRPLCRPRSCQCLLSLIFQVSRPAAWEPLKGSQGLRFPGRCRLSVSSQPLFPPPRVSPPPFLPLSSCIGPPLYTPRLGGRGGLGRHIGCQHN